MDHPSESQSLPNNKLWQKNPVDNFSYYVLDSEQTHLYINGEKYSTSTGFAQYLCDENVIDKQHLILLDDSGLVDQLVSENHLINT